MRSYVDYEGFRVETEPTLPDPPYVAGDHFAVCRGCERCAELEDEYLRRRAAGDLPTAVDVTGEDRP